MNYALQGISSCKTTCGNLLAKSIAIQLMQIIRSAFFVLRMFMKYLTRGSYANSGHHSNGTMGLEFQSVNLKP
jgi:hypothetical protein